MKTLSHAQRLFGADLSPSELAKVADSYREAFDNAPSTVNGQIVFDAQSRTTRRVESPKATLEKAFGSLSDAQVRAIEGAVGQALTKDLSPTSPLSTGYVVYDLEAPAKMLAPHPTPLRNRLPRMQGYGLAHRYKRITGFSGTATGGVGAINPGFRDSQQTSFANPGSAAALNFNRPRKISYAGDETVLPYVQNGLSDQLSWYTQFAAIGFQDMRALSRNSTLFACMLAEEREILYGRGTLPGYAGVLTAPSGTPTGAARTAATGETALTGFTTNVYVRVVAELGDYGVSAASAVSAGIAVSAGQVVDITIPNAVTGATGYKFFVSTGASDPGDAARWQYAGACYPNGKSVGRTPTLTATLQGALPTSGNSVAAYTDLDGNSVNLATTDGLSARDDNYDGILTWIMRSGGYNRAINSSFSTSNPGGEFQDAFAALWDPRRSDPDEIWLNGIDRKQISESIRGQSNNNYRITITEGSQSDITIGGTVGSIENAVTGKTVPFIIHPWLPQGLAPVISHNLPIPDSNIGQAWAIFNVQDYTAIEWPVIQMSYDNSVWWSGTLAAYAPEWSGIIRGIVPN